MNFLAKKYCEILNICDIKSNSEICRIKIKHETDTNIRRKIKSYILKLSKNKKEDIKSEL